MAKALQSCSLPEKVKDSLERLARQAAADLQDDLRSLILFGSAARGTFDPRRSNLDLLAVLPEVGGPELRYLHKLVRRFGRGLRVALVPLSVRDVHTSADAFALEWDEIREAHVVLHGKDIVGEVVVERERLRAQVEHELRARLVRLRRAYLEVGGRRGALQDLLVRSFASFAALFRTLLRLRGVTPAGNNAELARQVAEAFALGPRLMDDLAALRERRKRLRGQEIELTFESFLKAIEKVVALVDQEKSSPHQ